MGKKARLLSGTHHRPSRDKSHKPEVIRAGDIFEPSEREAAQNADRLEWVTQQRSRKKQPDEVPKEEAKDEAPKEAPKKEAKPKE